MLDSLCHSVAAVGWWSLAVVWSDISRSTYVSLFSGKCTWEWSTSIYETVCSVGRATDSQLHIPRGGVLGAGNGGTTWKHSSTRVIDAAAAEDDHWAGWRQCVVISDVRPAATADCQWRADEARGRTACSCVLLKLPAWTQRDSLLVSTSTSEELCSQSLGIDWLRPAAHWSTTTHQHALDQLHRH